MTSPSRRRLKRHHYTFGLVIILSLLFIALFLLIKPLSGYDRAIVMALPERFPGYFNMMVAISAIGAPTSMVLLALAWSGVEWAWGKRDRALIMSASLMSGPIFFAIKQLVRRNRPTSNYVDDLNLHSYSFPSGHASMSFAILMILAYLLSLRLAKIWSRLVTGALLVFVVLIGISRVYLQVHFPTDVLGGWILGAIVLLLVRASVMAYEHRTGKAVRA